MEFLTGFAPLAERFDGFVIDLWGVLHDGVTAYPGAVDCLQRIRAAGKPAVLLSNAPRRAWMARAAMREMGIPDELYTDLLTSGEATHALLAERSDPWFAALGRRVLHLGPERDRNVIDGLDLVLAETAAGADFVLNTGPDDHQDLNDVAAFEPILQDCAAHRLPMICANPDLEVIRGGRRVICAGALSLRYEALGGDVRWVGKPDPAIYAPVLGMLGVPAASALAVGDSLRTDIAGAASAGLASVWILGGIHARELAQDPQAARLAAAASRLSPVAFMPTFAWA